MHVLLLYPEFVTGYSGSVHIYKHIGNILEHICSFVTKEMSRIYSFHWLQSDLFVICASEGRLQMCRLQNNCITCIGEFNLPPGKERWSTASSLCGTEHFAVGDRNGNLYLYSFKHKNCIQVIRKAHNYMGITHLSFSESILFSLGT